MAELCPSPYGAANHVRVLTKRRRRREGAEGRRREASGRKAAEGRACGPGRTRSLGLDDLGVRGSGQTPPESNPPVPRPVPQSTPPAPPLSADPALPSGGRRGGRWAPAQPRSPRPRDREVQEWSDSSQFSLLPGRAKIKNQRRGPSPPSAQQTSDPRFPDTQSICL